MRASMSSRQAQCPFDTGGRMCFMVIYYMPWYQSVRQVKVTVSSSYDDIPQHTPKPQTLDLDTETLDP